MKKTFLYSLLILGLACTSPNLQLTKIEGKRLAIDTLVASDATIENFVAPYREKLEQNMQKALSSAPIDFVKTDGNMQSTLGNLLADLCYEMANPVFQQKSKADIDFVLMNHGGLRAPIPKGVVTTENAFLLMPFENELVVAQLSGKKVKVLFDYFVRHKRAHPLSKQVEVVVSGEDDYQVRIHGKPLDLNASYYVLTNDYLQTGGDGMTFFANPEALITLDYKMRQAILDYFAKVDVLKSSLDNRVIVKP